MKKRMGRLLLFFALLPLCMAVGCGTEKEEYTKISDMDFTVVEEADLPKELADAITRKKVEPFKLTYLAEDALYLAQGYGEQPSGGYSIAVEELFQAKEGICFKSILIGPAADEKVTTAATYPYIVVKLPRLETEVFFWE